MSHSKRRVVRGVVGLAAGIVLASVGACRSPGWHLSDEKALGPYSAAVVAGDYCFVSGKIGERVGRSREAVKKIYGRALAQFTREFERLKGESLA